MINEVRKGLEAHLRNTKGIKKFYRIGKDTNEETLLASISEFLESNSSKIHSYRFDSWVDSETFETVLMLETELVPSLEYHLVPSPTIYNLLNTEMKQDFLQNLVTKTILNYTFDMLDKKTGSTVSSDLNIKLKNYINIEFNVEYEIIHTENRVKLIANVNSERMSMHDLFKLATESKTNEQ